MAKIIYEKTFPKEDMEAVMKKALKNSCDDDMKDLPSFDEILKKFNQETVIIPLPKRIKNAHTFINKAIKISKQYKIDIRITKNKTHLTVDLYLDEGGFMGYLRDLFLYADDIAFFTHIDNSDICISIDYYTHLIRTKCGYFKP